MVSEVIDKWSLVIGALSAGDNNPSDVEVEFKSSDGSITRTYTTSQGILVALSSSTA